MIKILNIHEITTAYLNNKNISNSDVHVLHLTQQHKYKQSTYILLYGQLGIYQCEKHTD